MANVLTDLAADLYKAADVVARELTGTIPASTINANGSERVAKGDVIRSHFTRPATSLDISESMTIPEGTDQTVDNKTATISKTKAVQIPWTGENMKHVNNGSGFETIYGDQIAQAMRKLANEVEYDSNVSLAQNASRAVGTAGTTPFSANFDLIAQGRQILVDNGMPTNDGLLSLVLSTSAGTNLRNLAQLQKVNESGNDALLRQGVLLDLQGAMLRESGSMYSHAAGTGANYLTTALLPIGTSTITVDTGTGTILAGDVVTFAGDTNKYVVATALSGGSFTIGESGLRTAVANNAAVTVGAGYSGNIMFHRGAHEIIVRPPAVPEGGDAADDAMVVQDPRSGLLFEVRVYKGYRKAMFEVALAWGQKTWMPKYVAQVLG
tara:strand:+ start:6778 stop:7920 length:1143 start_codon:yes stop_codon:yes gene_type:complete